MSVLSWAAWHDDVVGLGGAAIWAGMYSLQAMC